MTIRELLERLQSGALSLADAEKYLTGYGLAAVGFHRLDLHRGSRSAVPEVVFGLSKTAEELIEIAEVLVERSGSVLLTRVSPEKAVAMFEASSTLRRADFDSRCGLMRIGGSQHRVAGRVAVISAGSSDLPVAEEAAGTLEFFGTAVDRHYDCGVAGIHRLLSSGESIMGADVLLVVAGMDGALPSVVGGLFRQPIIAVPTSVGYGAAFEGLAALLTMLNSCAPGVTVVNIDNGFGAAVAAISILKAISGASSRQRVLEEETWRKS